MKNNIKIFVIEDDLIYVKDLEITLEKLGYDFIGFSQNAENAFSKIKELEPDIILLDVNLNNQIDGVELAKKIKNDFYVGIIFLTAYSERETIENALVNFPYAYLIKPVQEKDLDIAIKIAYRHLNLQRDIILQKKWFETVNDLSPNIILFLSLDGKVEYINKKGCEILGYEREYIIGKKWADHFVPEGVKEEIEKLIAKALTEKGEFFFTHENPVLTSSGEKRDILWYNKSWIGEDGKLKGYLCTGQDITEKKIFEESISLTRNAIENATDGIVCIDEKGKIKFINRAASYILGHPQELLIDKKFPSFLLLKNYHNIENFVLLLKRIEKITYEVKIFNEKKGVLFYKVRANIFEYKNAIYLFFHIQDITIEAQTRIELKKLSMVAEQSPVATMITDNVGNIEYVNPAFLDITGYTLKEVIGKKPSILKSGFQNEGDYKVLWKTILSGNIWRGVLQNKKKNGELYWVKANIFPIFDDKGQIVNFVAEEEDITEERIAKISLEKTLKELENLNKELDRKVKEEVNKNLEKEKLLIQQSRFAAMGEMLGNIAHQWRQPLNAVGILVQNLYFNYKNGRLNKEYFDRTVSRTMELLKHMSNTIDDFRNFFKPDREMRDFSLVEITEKTLLFMKDSFDNKGIKYSFTFEKDYIIKGYPNQFSQVLINLLNNSLEALVERNVENPFVNLSIKENNGILYIKVEDNAGGIPDDIIEKIFEPYFTTKEKGTGIGLYMSKVIIENNFKGKIYVKNTKKGAEFTIELKL